MKKIVNGKIVEQANKTQEALELTRPYDLTSFRNAKGFVKFLNDKGIEAVLDNEYGTDNILITTNTMGTIALKILGEAVIYE